MRRLPLLLILCVVTPLPTGADVTLVRDGRPCAAVVLPAGPTPIEKLAAEELQWHIQRMSGAKLTAASRPREGLAPIYIGRAAEAVNVRAEVLKAEHYFVTAGDGWLAITGRDGAQGGPVAKANPLNLSAVQTGTLFGVYHLLDDLLGVRWLWPGEDGTFVPKRRTISLPARSILGGPKLVQRHMRSHRSRGGRTRVLTKLTRDGRGVPRVDDEAADRLARQEALWLRRHRMGRREHFAFGHAFTGWWGKYGETHPEYFARLVGREQPYPAAERCKLCVSNPAVTDRIIADWKAAGAKSHLRACPNDSRAYCTCENCRKWDLPVRTTPQNVDESVLTYRYVRFYKVLAENVAAINPDVYVCGYAYSNYRTPPEGVKLPGNLLLGYVGGMDAEAREEWRKWSDAGAKLFFRPNWFHDGHNAFYLPLHEAGTFLSYARAHGMLGADFDSLLGHYATQGAFYYLVARLQVRSELSVEQVIQEYCGGFGPAAAEIRKYIDYWEKHTARCLAEVHEHAEAMRGAKRAFVGLMPQLFDDRTLAPAERLLDAAGRKVAAADPVFARRVRFLREGIRHVRLTREAVRAREDLQSRRTPENEREAAAAAKALYEYRKSIEGSFVDWTEYSSAWEIRLGDYTGLRLAAQRRLTNTTD